MENRESWRMGAALAALLLAATLLATALLVYG